MKVILFDKIKINFTSHIFENYLIILDIFTYSV